MNTEHPLYPIYCWLPLIGQAFTNGKELPFDLRLPLGTILTFEVLLQALKPIKAEINVNMDPESDEEYDWDYYNSVTLLYDFCLVVDDFINHEKTVYLNTNMVMHGIHLDNKIRADNFQKDFIVFYPSMDKKDRTMEVLKRMMKFMDDPLIQECNGNERSYVYEGVTVLQQGSYTSYYTLHWGS